MQISAIQVARVFYFLEAADLNPKGRAFFPDVIRALGERYRFQKMPQRFEDLDDTKGVEFHLGRSGETTIDKVVVFQFGISLETRHSTERSDELLNEALNWGAEHLGLRYEQAMVKRRAYVSQLSFFSQAPMLFLNPVLDRLSERISRIVATNLNLDTSYDTSSVMMTLDPASQRLPSAPFSIERRVGIAFAENKYFSSAPIQTREHLVLLEEYEQAVIDAHQHPH